jgi:hypothetical protein
MVHSLKLKKKKKPLSKIPNKVKLCLSIDREVLRRLMLVIPKGMKPQEAVRQIIDFYLFHKEIDW